jgi:hypothetical protein
MPSPKSGNAGSAVPPTDPKDPHEADKADPGETAQIKASQQQSQTGKYGSVKLKPYKKDPKKKSWIEIEMLDEKKRPVPGQAFRIILSDNQSVVEGTLNEKGFYRVEGIDSGTCKITFPDLDKDAWEKA